MPGITSLILVRRDREAVVVDERRLRDITKSVFNWSLDGTIDLRRFEVLEVNGGAKDAKVRE